MRVSSTPKHVNSKLACPFEGWPEYVKKSSDCLEYGDSNNCVSTCTETALSDILQLLCFYFVVVASSCSCCVSLCVCGVPVFVCLSVCLKDQMTHKTGAIYTISYYNPSMVYGP